MFGILKHPERLINRVADRIMAKVAEDAAQDARFGGVPQFLPQRFFAGADFAAFATKYPGAKEIIREPLYGIKTYATSGYTQRIFFDQNFGGATLGYGDTNLQQANQLPAGEAFLITNIRVLSFPSITDVRATNPAGASMVALAEWYVILQTACWLELWILQKPYLRVGPLTMFPPGIGLGAFATSAAAAVSTTTVANVQSGTPDTKALFVMDPPHLLSPLDNFYVSLNWDQLRTVTTAGRLGVMFDGYHIRNIQ